MVGLNEVYMTEIHVAIFLLVVIYFFVLWPVFIGLVSSGETNYNKMVEAGVIVSGIIIAFITIILSFIWAMKVVF